MVRAKLLNNVSWLLFDKIIRIIGSLFIGVWIARYLGPEDYGVLNYAMAYVALFALLVNLGLDQIVIREIVKHGRMVSYYLGTAFFLKLIGALTAMLLIIVSAHFSESSSQVNLVIIIIGCMLLFQSLDVIDFFYQAKVLSKYVVMARTSAFVLSSLINIYFIVYEYSVIYFAIANVANALFSACFLVAVFKWTGNHILEWRFSIKIAKQLLLYCWPLALSMFLISIHTKVDQVMIGSMLNHEQVGIYSVAVKLSEFWIFVPGIMVSTLMPYFIQLRESDNEMYNHRLMQLYSIMFWMGVFVGVITIVFGRDIIGLLFGAAYADAYAALALNIWSGVFISQGIARGIWMISENLQKYRLYNNLIAVTLNIIINLALIPMLGITGAAIATLLTQAFGTWVFSLLWRPLRGSTINMIKSANPCYLVLRDKCAN